MVAFLGPRFAKNKSGLTPQQRLEASGLVFHGALTNQTAAMHKIVI